VKLEKPAQAGFFVAAVFGSFRHKGGLLIALKSPAAGAMPV